MEEIVRRIKYVKALTTEQVADSIGYSRVYLTRVMKNEGSSDLEKILTEKYKDVFQNVTLTVTQPQADADYKKLHVKYVQSLEDIVSLQKQIAVLEKQLIAALSSAAAQSNAPGKVLNQNQHKFAGTDTPEEKIEYKKGENRRGKPGKGPSRRN